MIRRAVAEDVPAIVRLGRLFLRHSAYRGVIDEQPDQMTILARQLIAAETGAVLIAEVADVLVGMLGILASPHHLTGLLTAGEVFWYVEPKSRGRCGVALFRAAETWARELGAVAITMVAPDERVEHLYERRGYVPLERAYWKALT